MKKRKLGNLDANAGRLVGNETPAALAQQPPCDDNRRKHQSDREEQRATADALHRGGVHSKVENGLTDDAEQHREEHRDERGRIEAAVPGQGQRPGDDLERADLKRHTSVFPLKGSLVFLQ